MANIAYQYRLYPDPEQAAFFVRTFGCCRKVWNLMLSDKIEYLVRVEKHFPSSQPAMQLMRMQKPGHKGSFHTEDPLPEMRHGI